jgi:hypothetical protein
MELKPTDVCTAMAGITFLSPNMIVIVAFRPNNDDNFLSR